MEQSKTRQLISNIKLQINLLVMTLDVYKFFDYLIDFQEYMCIRNIITQNANDVSWIYPVE